MAEKIVGYNDVDGTLPDVVEARVGEIAQDVSGNVVAWPTGSEPSLTGVPDGTLWVEYTP